METEQYAVSHLKQKGNSKVEHNNSSNAFGFSFHKVETLQYAQTLTMYQYIGVHYSRVVYAFVVYQCNRQGSQLPDFSLRSVTFCYTVDFSTTFFYIMKAKTFLHI